MSNDSSRKFGNAKATTTEVKMMKSSVEFKSIEQLNLPSYAAAYVREKISEDPEKIVYKGRELAFYHEDRNEIEPKSLRLFVEALDREGFIRHDIGSNHNAHKMGRLILNITYVISCSFFDPSRRADYKDFREANEAYELYLAPSDARVELFKSFIRQSLTDREYEVIILRYGLDGEKPHYLEETAEIFGVTKETIRQIEAKAIRSLSRSTEHYPEFFYLFFASNREVRQEVIKAQTELAFIERSGLVSCTGPDMALIEELGLSTRAYSCLIRAGFNTISDILNCSSEELLKVRNLGKKGALEVEHAVKLYCLNHNIYT